VPLLSNSQCFSSSLVNFRSSSQSANASCLGLCLLYLREMRARQALLSRPWAPKLHQSPSLPGSPGCSVLNSSLYYWVSSRRRCSRPPAELGRPSFLSSARVAVVKNCKRLPPKPKKETRIAILSRSPTTFGLCHSADNNKDTAANKRTAYLDHCDTCLQLSLFLPRLV
jgi:hypothetical protein